MKILISLMYYRPHYSGLTIYTERLARALARRGHQVTVLTSRFDTNLLAYEICDGVTVIRPRVLLKVSKGVIMPSMPLWAWKLIRQSDVINAHVPQPDAAVMISLSRLLGKPSVLTYHCDLQLPNGVVRYLANQASHLANQISADQADTIVTNTLDYAQNSPFLSNYISKIQPIPPPIELSPVEPSMIESFREKFGIRSEQRIIGMASRLATEKGVEYLVQALPAVLEKYPTARVLFAGQYLEVLGEEIYAKELEPLIHELGDHWTFLGILPPQEWAAFFHEAEITVLPSINSTESFGMVQVESMTCESKWILRRS
jgi:glycosyltransferase involved in cell wall biosynthesis